MEWHPGPVVRLVISQPNFLTHANFAAVPMVVSQVSHVSPKMVCHEGQYMPLQPSSAAKLTAFFNVRGDRSNEAHPSQRSKGVTVVRFGMIAVYTAE